VNGDSPEPGAEMTIMLEGGWPARNRRSCGLQRLDGYLVGRQGPFTHRVIKIKSAFNWAGIGKTVDARPWVPL